VTTEKRAKTGNDDLLDDLPHRLLERNVLWFNEETQAWGRGIGDTKLPVTPVYTRIILLVVAKTFGTLASEAHVKQINFLL
jgi:hypothetical protein